MSKIDIQDVFWEFPIGSPHGPADHLVAMTAFQQEHSLGCQPYTVALGLINPVGDKEWRASSADKRSASGTYMGDGRG